MERALTGDELTATLDDWSGAAVAVRVVASGDELVAVFAGILGLRSAAKHPSLFWPLEAASGVTTIERSGVYVHTNLVEDAAIHTGDSVVAWRQGGTITNVRRL